jgi:DGQHR domain-containing protein
MKIRCLKTVVESGARRYPLFVGFAPAAEIARIAEAPSFTKKTSHRQISVNVLEPPVKDWQRPLDPERVGDIKRAFNDSGALMPNPVLLSENGEEETSVRLVQEKASGSIPSNVWEVVIDEKGSKPLWVLDGQHRINGLAASKQSSNEIPVVLLLNDDESAKAYGGRDFAELFAQVTTTAKKLDELHNAWLTFAYDLDEYSKANPDHDEHHLAMEAVAETCRLSELTDGRPNPFLNGVRFNPSYQQKSAPFLYGCNQLKELVRKHYYRETQDPMSPIELADQMGLAMLALKEVVRAPQGESVFFGDGDFSQLPMQDAFVVGVLKALQQPDPPDDWVLFLKGLEFHKTDWDFKSWTQTTGGKAGTDSKKIAERVFTQTFKSGELPEGVTNLGDYLKGSRAKIDLEFSRLGPTGRPLSPGRKTLSLNRGDDESIEVDDELHVRVAKSYKTSNVARLEVVDASSNVSNPRKLGDFISGGHLLDPDADERRLQVAVYMHFYGGRGTEAKLTIKW